MGASAAKEIAPMVISGLPAVIGAFQTTRANSNNKDDDKRIGVALDRLQRDRHDIEQLIQNQDQLLHTLEGLAPLLDRLQGGGNNGNNQITSGQSQGKIRIEMDLPEGAEERDDAMRNFWRTLGIQAAAYTAMNNQSGALENEPLEASSQASGRRSQQLCCEICTQRYNVNERRPTLLPLCGHTFCKECLHQANQRNHRCPTCRKESNADVDQHPTNFSILDFLAEEDEEDRKLKGRKAKLPNDSSCDLTFEDQLEMARQLSIKGNQEEEDLRLAQKLQEEEDRILRFSHHGDMAKKNRMVDDSEDDMPRRLYRDDNEHESAMRNSHRYDHNSYERAPNFTEREQDSSDDGDGDCHYNEARRMMGKMKSCTGSDLDDDDVCCLNSCKMSDGEAEHPPNAHDSRGENSSEMFQTERQEEIQPSSSQTLFEEENARMLDRAKMTYEQDKEARRKKKMLKEQEDLDLAVALSMSLSDHKSQDLCVGSD